jgi:Family of unknown function (DUF6228)
LVTDGLTAHTTFWVGPEGIEHRLDDFFRSLEGDWRGWDGPRQWKGMEGGLSLTCTHNGLGTITVAAVLENLSGSDWTAKAALAVGAGEELSHLARDLRRLLTLTP